MEEENNYSETDDTNENRKSLSTTLGGAFDSRRGFLKKGLTASAAGLGLSMGAGPVGASGDDQTTTQNGDQQDTDEIVDTLNYALTLERLEATFYTRGLEMFSEDDIMGSDIGQQLSDDARSSLPDRLQEVESHEQAHVDALVGVINDLGGDPVAEGDIEFQFQFETFEEFIETAQTLETTGVSAYDGAIAQLSGSDELLTAAATIATVEGRHSAYLNNLTGKSPFPNAFDETKSPEEVTELIQPFIAGESTTTETGTTTETETGTTTETETGTATETETGTTTTEQ